MRFLATIITLALVFGGCSAPQVNSSRLGSADLVTMTDGMTTSLLASPAIGGRTDAAAPWIVSIDRLSNQSNVIVPTHEKQAFLARLRAQLSQADALMAHNIRFLATPTRRGNLPDATAEAVTARPTHELTATLYSLSNRTREARSEAYLASFQLIDLATGQILWEDKYEVKHAVLRNKFD